MKSLFGNSNSNIAFSRADTSVLGIWWWTIDRWMLAAVILLMGIGALLVMSANPPVADRINVDSFHFVRRQFVFLGLAAICAFGISLLSIKWVRRLASIMFLGVICLLIITPLSGPRSRGGALDSSGRDHPATLRIPQTGLCRRHCMDALRRPA